MNWWARPSEWSHAAAGTAGGRFAPPATHYFAFLSYSHRDAADADWLHARLERFKVPSSLAGRLTAEGVIPRRLTPIFRDRHELAAGDDLDEEIREALAASRCLIVLCSPAAAKSKWTNAEIVAFKRIHPEGCVIAAIVAGEPFASEIKGREQEECLPPALRQKYDRRGRPTGKRAEPLAADLRESGGGRRVGFLKIVAGMLGVGLDDLVQREQLRRQRRLAGVTAGSLAGMLAASLLAVTAIQARNEARDQRREAEGLVAFMLGDLKDKLEPIGRLDALDGVGSRVLEYYSRQDTSELSDAALLQRSRALSLTAQVAYLRGNLGEAAWLYSEAMAGTGEAVRRSPDDPQRLFDHAQNVFWIGELARKSGQLGEAEASYREYKRLADQMVTIEPDNLKWRMESAYGDVNIGIVLSNQRRFAEAAGQFTSALGLTESVASIDRGNAEYQKELSKGLAWAADAQLAQGRLNAAVRLRERQVSFLRQLLADGKANVVFREHLIPAHQALGRLLTSRGEFERGIGELRLAVAEADGLIPTEPDNHRWKGLAARAHLELATTLLSIGRSGEASQQGSAGCSLTADVRSRDAIVAWRPLQTECLKTQSRMALQAGASGKAVMFAERALASARTERSADPLKHHYSIAAAYELVGDTYQQAGNRSRADEAWRAGLASLPRGVAEMPNESRTRAELLQRLGRASESKALFRTLEEIGYRFR